MAEVHVTSWAEFLSAIQVSGDTVHCPEDAVWDMNELEPDGHIGTIRFDCDNVYGHNTTIKNLRYDGTINFHSGFMLASDLHWENMLVNTGSDRFVFNREGNFSTVEECSQMSLCKVSGHYTWNGGWSAFVPFRAFKAYRCGFNIEVASSGSVAMPPVMEYCNFLLQAPNVSAIDQTDVQHRFFHKFSNIVTVAPNCTYDLSTMDAIACVFRGRKERLQSYGYQPQSQYMSLYCTTDMQAMQDSKGVVGVTEAQLRDAAYLQSIGFPIGV